MKTYYAVYADTIEGSRTIYGQLMNPGRVPQVVTDCFTSFKKVKKLLKIHEEYKKNGQYSSLCNFRVLDISTIVQGTGLSYPYIYCSNWTEWYNDDGSLKPGAKPSLRNAR